MENQKEGTEHKDIKIAKINFKQAIIVAIITIIPSVTATYFVANKSDQGTDWKAEYESIKTNYDSLNISIQNRLEISDLSILLMDSPENKYPSIKDEVVQ